MTSLPYESISPVIRVAVDGIVSIHYFEYTGSFRFDGESHDFWELIYCDRGTLFLSADGADVVLKSGHFFVHPPNQFHAVKTDGVHTANSVVLSFSGSIPELLGIAGSVQTADDFTRNALFTILRESRFCFGNRLGQVIDPKLVRIDRETVFGAEQVILRELELLLIHLIRNEHTHDGVTPPLSRGGTDRLSTITAFLETNTHNKLSIAEICSVFSISPTTLKKMFSASLGTGVMAYFLDCKVREAKRMICEDEKTYSQISYELGFSSVHYFSRLFKQKTGMSPTEYSKSVKSLMEQAGTDTR